MNGTFTRLDAAAERILVQTNTNDRASPSQFDHTASLIALIKVPFGGIIHLWATLAVDQPVQRPSGSRPRRPSLAIDLGQSRRAIERAMADYPIVRDRRQNAKGGIVQTRGLFQHRVEHWLEVARRRVDDAEHLGGRGLSVERRGKLGIALGKFSPRSAS